MNAVSYTHLDVYKRQQFYRACVLHDIGKIEVPHAVLTNRATDRSCALALFEHKDEILIPLLRKKRDESFSLPETIKSSEDLLSYLQNELHIRPQSISPIKLLLPQPIDEEVIAQLTQDVYKRQGLKRLLLTIFIQILIVFGLYFCLR